MEQSKIDRINILAKKSKSDGLTDDEKSEQAALRAEYITSMKSNMHGILKNTYIQYPDGTKEKLKPKQKKL